MAKSNSKRKIRTKEHINADLSENYVERIALKKGFSVEKIEHDYGYDLQVFTYDANGEIENGQIYFQLKAKNILTFIKDEKFLSYQVQRKDLDLWNDELYPVIFVVYDVKNELAYWLDVQDYVQEHDLLNTSSAKSISINIPRTNVLDTSAMEGIATRKRDVISRINDLLNQ